MSEPEKGKDHEKQPRRYRYADYFTVDPHINSLRQPREWSNDGNQTNDVFEGTSVSLVLQLPLPPRMTGPSVFGPYPDPLGLCLSRRLGDYASQRFRH